MELKLEPKEREIEMKLGSKSYSVKETRLLGSNKGFTKELVELSIIIDCIITDSEYMRYILLNRKWI